MMIDQSSPSMDAALTQHLYPAVRVVGRDKVRVWADTQEGADREADMLAEILRGIHERIAQSGERK